MWVYHPLGGRVLSKSVPQSKGMLFLGDFLAELSVKPWARALFSLLLLLLKQPPKLCQK